MAYKNLNLPATIIREVNGKKYRINGTLMSINESADMCTVKFGDRISNNIPTSNVYLNEGIIDSIKDMGKKAWNSIKRVVKTIGGFLLPVDENGKKLVNFINAPINVVAMKLPKSIVTVASDTVLNYADEHSIKIKNQVSLMDALADSEAEDSKEINKYWGRVMKEYAKTENKNLSLSSTIKLVNEKYYHKVGGPSMGTLNEAAIPSLHNLIGGYGEEVDSKQLVGLIYQSLWSQLNPLSDLDPDKRLDEADTAKPLLIWGAPGIGKTAIISKAAKLLEEDGYNLGMHIIKCAALKRDDFELPDTTKNIVGQKLAISNPKTWLPVYDPKGLTKEQLAITDAVYNSGIYKMYDSTYTASEEDVETYSSNNGTYDPEQIANDIKNNTNPRIKQLLESSKQNGGIIFFDEFARLEPNVTNIMMGLMGERMYGEDFILASQWTTIAAANRLSDDLKPESDEEFRRIWDNAKQGRYQHYTYVPTKEDWLEWARKRNKRTGLQNVDEKFCKFIEMSPAYVWYNALDLKSQDDIPTNVKQTLGGLGSIDNNGQMVKTRTGILAPDQLDVIGDYLAEPKTRDQLSVNTWNPRTWDEVVNRNMLQALRNIFGKSIDDLNGVMSPIKQSYKEYGETIEYDALNLDDEKLEAALNKLPRRKWYMWAEPFMKRVDPTGNLINTNRLAYWNAWIEKCLIPDAVGAFNKPAAQWKEYNSTSAFLSQEVINNIWKLGYNNELSLVKFSKSSKYDMFPEEKWKSADPVIIKKIIKTVLDNYPGDFKADVAQDYQALQNISLEPKAALNKVISDFDIKLIDGDRSTFDGTTIVDLKNKRKFNILYDPDVTTEEQALSYAYTIKNCPSALKMVNVFKWLAIIALELPGDAGMDYLSDALSECTVKYINAAKSVPGYYEFINENTSDESIVKFPYVVYTAIKMNISNSFTEA